MAGRLAPAALPLALALAGCLGGARLEGAEAPGAPAALGLEDLPAARPSLATGFHEAEEVPGLLEGLAALRPDIASTFPVGASVEGRPILGLRLLAPGAAEGRARVLVDGGVHGNEVIGVESVLYLAGWLAENHGRNATATRLLEGAEVRIVPLVSPDGRVALTRPNANGVNLNRNFDVDWGNPSPLCRSQAVSPELYRVGGSTFDYSGPRPLSEPESQALAALMQQFRPQIYLSFHTGRHALIRPWAACSPPHPMPPEDDAVFEAIESWVQNQTTYQNTGNADETARRERAFPPGAASGSSMDWCYLAYHCVALTPEVTLETRLEGDPVARAEEVLPVALHMLENARAYAEWRIPS